ncbi:MAG TPA: hypothetical protein VGK00_11990 [Anaerolineales bacterium]|jgi:hypothetical protein
MLVIASDIHLGDGTCARSISPQAFQLFSERLNQMAFQASIRSDGLYWPIENIDLVLMGDILDPLHSTRWLDAPLADPGCVRPWSNSSSPRFAEKLAEVTRAILVENAASLQVLKSLSAGEIVRLPPAAASGPDFDSHERFIPRFNIHYMTGNHDWYYHLPGRDFDAIRAEIISALGLSNPPDKFPWDLAEADWLREVFADCKVLGRHGDKFDRFNFDREKGRDASSIGDVFVMEVVNRYPLAVFQELGGELPPSLLESFRQLTNIRPALAAPLWITSRIQQYAGSDTLMDKLKQIWDRVTDEFLEVSFIREADRAFRFDLVDALELVVKLSKKTSFQTINDLVIWMREKMWEGGSFTSQALREPAFLDGSAHYIAYGHTHHYEAVPLDISGQPPHELSQYYFNSGTWHPYFDLAVHKPETYKFVHYQSMSYLAFYAHDECAGRNFETWTGSLG